MHYAEHGRFLGGEMLPDEELDRYRHAQNVAWDAAEGSSPGGLATLNCTVERR